MSNQVIDWTFAKYEQVMSRLVRTGSGKCHSAILTNSTKLIAIMTPTGIKAINPDVLGLSCLIIDEVDYS